MVTHGSVYRAYAAPAGCVASNHGIGVGVDQWAPSGLFASAVGLTTTARPPGGGRVAGGRRSRGGGGGYLPATGLGGTSSARGGGAGGPTGGAPTADDADRQPAPREHVQRLGDGGDREVVQVDLVRAV